MKNRVQEVNRKSTFDFWRVLLLLLIAAGSWGNAQAHPDKIRAGKSLRTPVTPRVFYVSPAGAGLKDGSSWANAYEGTGLQTAINDAKTYSSNSVNAIAHVWVAAGTYKPTTTTNRGISFSMKNYVEIYGGFVGTELQLSDRPAINLSTPSSTTLSGNIGDPDDDADNTSHVINNSDLDQTAVIDGFCIVDGNSDNNSGAGMKNVNCFQIIRNCCFAENSGPTYANDNSGTTVTNCSFINNRAKDGSCLELAVHGKTRKETFTNCLFQGNTSESDESSAGVLALRNIDTWDVQIQVDFVNCTFVDNRAAGEGVALFYIRNDKSDPSAAIISLTNCIAWNNHGSATFRNSTGPSVISANYCLFDSSVSGFTENQVTKPTTLPFENETSARLMACSPAVNAGDPASTTATSGTTDLAGNSRFYNDGRIDIGMDEFQGEPVTATPISIVNQPASTSAVCVGSPVSVSVTAEGSDLTYQWLKDGQPLSPAQTTATLSLTSVQISQSGSYSVVISNSCYTKTSGAFSLTVQQGLMPTVALQTGTTLPILQNTPFVSLTVTGCETGTINWKDSNGSSGTGTAISVPTSATGTLVYSATCTTGSCSSAPGSATVSVSPPEVTGSFDGFVNGADCATFRGWAWDRNKANTAVSVDILDGAKVIATISANEFRQDLKDAGKGNGIHAFRWSITNDLKNGLPHYLSARISRSSFILKDSPKSLVCEGVPVPGGNKPPQPPSPTILIAPLVVQVGVPFSGTLVAFTDPEGQPLTYKLSGLPGGLAMNETTRVISGTPNESGTFVLAYQATDPGPLTNSVSFPLTVNPQSTTNVTGSFEGYLDKVECGTVRGWVWDRNKPNTPVTVEFYTGSTVWGSVVANIYRDDLKTAGKGNGSHGYSFTVPPALKDNTSRLIYGRVQGSTYVLKDSGKPLICPSPVRLSAESESRLEVTVLGNPVSDQVMVEIRGAEGQPLNLQLSDVNGRLVSQRQIEAAKVLEQQTLSVGQQPAGLLLLRVSTPAQNRTLKILKP
jgi:hypothetical protein